MITRDEISKSKHARMFFALAVLTLVLLGAALIFTGKMTLIGMQMLGISNYTTHTQEIDLAFTSTQEYIWELEEHPALFNLRSVMLDGETIGEGKVRATLITPDGERYVIMKSRGLKRDDKITGMQIEEVANDATGNTDTTGNDSETGIITNEGFANIPAENTSETGMITNEGFAQNDTSVVLATEGGEGANQTEGGEEQTGQEPATPEKEITLHLEYQRGTRWDANDDGTASTEADAVDLTVAETGFSWDADESKLCTRWTITSEETGISTTLCNGNAECCALAGVAPKESSWDAPLYIYYEQYGTTASNTVSTQVIYLDQSLDVADTHFESVQSQTETLAARFEAAKRNEFSRECMETCMLPAGLNSTQYTILFEIENGTKLTVNGITYSVEDLGLGNMTVMLNPEITDSKGNVLPSTVEVRKKSTLEKVAEKRIARREKKQGTRGNEAMANSMRLERGDYKIGIDLTEAAIPVKRIELADTTIQDDTDRFIRVERVNTTEGNSGFIQMYAIDPTAINFTNATVTVTATGNSLYKCKEWDFDTQTCNGEWTRLMDITPGKNYTFILTADDPAFAETRQPSDADSYVRQDSANNNYGTATTMIVQSRRGSRNRRVFIYFDVSNISSDSQMQYANLSIYKSANSGSATRNYEIYRLTGAWTETGITWNNQPTVAATPTWITSVETGTNNVWVSWDVTSDVQGFVNGTYANYGWMIKDDTDDSRTTYSSTFRSNNYATTTLRPQLALDYISDTPPYTALVSPPDGPTTSSTIANFTCDATDDFQLNNSTFYWNYTGSWQANGTASTTGTSNQTSFIRPIPPATVTWNCQACDNKSQCSFAESNRTTKYINDPAPMIEFTAPTPANGSALSSDSIEIGISVADYSLQSFIFNWNGTNITVFDESLWVMYNLDDNAAIGENDTLAIDVSASGNNGIITNGPAWVDGRFDKALKFDGIDDYVNLSKAVRDDITILYWVKTTQTGAAGPDFWAGTGIVDSEVSGVINDFGTALIGDKFAFGVADGYTIMSKTPINDGEWHHVAATRDKATGNLSVYVDCVLENTTIGPTTTLNESQVMRIGGTQTGTAYFDGTVDELRIYNRTLGLNEFRYICYANFNKANATDWHFYNNITDLSGEFTYTAYAKDHDGNTNQSETRNVVLDLIPPSAVTGLTNQSSGPEWIYWSWTNPADPDFAEAMVYINGTNIANNSGNQYNATGLQENTTYTITLHTKDAAGNINSTDVNSTSATVTGDADVNLAIRNSKADPINTTMLIYKLNGGADLVYNDTKKVHTKKLKKGDYDIRVEPVNHTILSIEIPEINIKSALTQLVDVEQNNGSQGFLFSMNPLVTDTMKVKAKGTLPEGDGFRILNKCEQWDFTNSICNGSWVPYAALMSDSTYEFDLNYSDPGFMEGISTCVAENLAAKGSFGSACAGTYPSSCGAAGDLLSCNDANSETFSASNSGYAGIKISQYNTSVTSCSGITKVEVCYEWWVAGGFSPTDCDVSMDNQGGTNFTAITTTCPSTGADPGVTCIDVTNNKSWICSNFFGASGIRAQIKSELMRSSGGSKVSTWDVLAYNVTYTTQAVAPAPSNQTVELGDETTIVWNVTGSGGNYWVYRNGTLFEGPGNWTNGIPLITIPNVYFLGDWNYTLVFNELGGPNSTTTTKFTVVDNIRSNCSDTSGSTSSPATGTITVDGNMAEWAGILANPYNYVTDLSLAQGDTDAISTTDRDMVKFAYTYNNQYLNFYFMRMIRGSRQVSMIVYVDYDLDGYMNATDKVVKFVWSGSNQLYDSDIYSYVPSNPSGDLMQGSGFDMPGTITNGVQLETQVLGGAPNGIELETRITWAQLGLPGPTPLLFKGSSAMGSGTNLPTQLEDNVGNTLSESSSFVVLKQSQEKAATNGTSVYYSFELLNCGNKQEKIDLTNLSNQGWGMMLYYSNGTQITDTNANGKIDVLLGTEGYSAIILKLNVPSNATTGTTDITNITAMSSSNNASVTATTTVASIAITPKTKILTGVAGMTIGVNYTVYNYQNTNDTININATSSQGWPLVFRYLNGTQLTDTNGDGRIDVGNLLAKQSIGVILHITINGSATPGTIDGTNIRINSSSTPTMTDTAVVNTTVNSRLLLVKSYNRTVSVDTTYYYQLNVTNNWNTTEPIEITKTSNLGWPTALYNNDLVTPLTDTNSNGKVDITVPAYGGKKTFYVAITVPLNATMGASEVTDVFANSSSNSSVYQTARINETVRGITFYNDSGRTNIDFSYFINESVYARGFYLQGISTVYMVWYDGIAARRTSPNITVTAQGTADDAVATNASFDTGMWTVIIFNAADGIEVTRGSFNLVDPIYPSLVAWKPPQGYTTFTSTWIEIAANSTDNVGTYLVYANISYPNGSSYWLELYNSTNITWNNTFLIPNLTGRYNVTFFGRDVYGNVNNTEKTYFLVYDNIPPSVFSMKPTAGSQYNYTTMIEIAANVTDNIAVSTVHANITHPNGTVQTIALTNAGGAKYNSSFVTPTLPGAYTVRIFANDTSSNINNTETTSFIVLAPAPTFPQLNLNSPAGGYTSSNSTVTFNWTATSSQYGSMLCNLTIDGQVNASNIPALNNTPTTYTVNGLSPTTHYWNVSCWGDSTKVNRSETRNFTISTSQSVLGFSLTLPGQAPKNASLAGNVTAQMSFNSSQNTYYGMDPCVGATANCQNSTLPFFQYLNTGNVNLTLNVSLNSSLPSVFKLRVNTIYNNATANEVNTSPRTIGSDMLPGATLDAWFFGDFINAYPNQSTSRNLTSMGGQS